MPIVVRIDTDSAQEQQTMQKVLEHHAQAHSFRGME